MTSGERASEREAAPLESEPATHAYVAVLVYASGSPDPGYSPLYEESFLLIQARDEAEAQDKARAHAVERCATFQNAQGQTITWSLKHVVDVRPLLEERLTDGAELYARHFRNYDAYCAFEPLLGGTAL